MASLSGSAVWLNQANYRAQLTNTSNQTGAITINALPPVGFVLQYKQETPNSVGIIRTTIGDTSNAIALEWNGGAYTLKHNTETLHTVSVPIITSQTQITFSVLNSYAKLMYGTTVAFNDIDLGSRVLEYEDGIVKIEGITGVGQNSTLIVEDIFLQPMFEIRDDLYCARGVYAEKYFNVDYADLKNKPTIASFDGGTISNPLTINNNNGLYMNYRQGLLSGYDANLYFNNTEGFVFKSKVNTQATFSAAKITVGDVYFTGDLYKNGVLYVNNFDGGTISNPLTINNNNGLYMNYKQGLLSGYDANLYFNNTEGFVFKSKVNTAATFSAAKITVGDVYFTGDLYKNGTLWTAQSFNGGTVANQINVGNANGVSFLAPSVYQTNGYYTSLGLGGGTGGYSVWFKNDANRTVDGGARTATLRNDDGMLRLMSTNIYTQVEKTAHTANANDCTLELFSPNTGDYNREVSLRFHQGVQYWGQIRYRASQFHFTDGATGNYNPVYTGASYVSNGDSSITRYGPNATWGCYLNVGASGSQINYTTAQCVSTNGNLHLDCANDKDLFLNYYSGRPTRVYGDLIVNGVVRLSTSIWHTSTDGIQRFYFAPNESTYYKTGFAHVWRNAGDATKMLLYDTGYFYINHDNGNYVYFEGDTIRSLTYFTGSHRSFTGDVELFKNANDYMGLIVVSTGEYVSETDKGVKRGKDAITINDAMPLIELSSQARQKSVYGVVSTIEKGEEREMTGEGMRMKVKKGLGEHRVIINSLGEGGIWVCDEGGSFENGDLICSSSVSGYAMKQDDDLMRNYTVAKITMNCNFNPKISPQKTLLKDEEGKNILDENGMIQFVDSDETEYEYEMRWLTKEGVRITKEEYTIFKEQGVSVYRAAFVGCTYHCG